MRSIGIVLILSGAFIVAAVIHSKQVSLSQPSSSSSTSGGTSSGSSGLVQHFTEKLPGGGDITVNASDANAAIANVQAETGQTPVGLVA